MVKSQYINILYDGWSLVYQPLSPAALHLLAILDALPDRVHPIVALPGPAPGWLGEVEVALNPTLDRPIDHLFWEQLGLPRLASQVKADLLHLTTPSAPVSGRVPGVVSPCGYFEGSPEEGSDRLVNAGFWSRLRSSFARGGLSRARAILLPEIGVQGREHATASGSQIFRMPALVRPDFTPQESPKGSREVNGFRLSKGEIEGLELPETFVLYHGPADIAHLTRLAESWSWAAGPIGVYYPLLLVGLSEGERHDLAGLAKAIGLEDSLRVLPTHSPDTLARLFHSCSAVFHPALVSPWGGSAHHALACGKPFVALDTPLASSIVGPAAYLVPGEDSRAFGAAIITVIVEEQVSNRLSRAALERSAGWDKDHFGKRLVSIYESLVTE